jgi:Helicase conserved C-terminal domain
MSSIRALTTELAARSDAALRELLSARPDLMAPPVPDFAALAARACGRASISRALDSLDLPQLQVLEAVHLTTDEDQGRAASAATLAPLLRGSTPAVLIGLLESLRGLALLYSHPPASDPAADSAQLGFLPVSSVRDVLGLHPAGLGRTFSALARTQPAIGARLQQTATALRAAGYPLANVDDPGAAAASLESWLGDPGTLPALLRGAPPTTADVLAKFRHGAMGSVPRAGRPVSPASPGLTPVEWLLAHGLLVPLDDDHVELPYAVGLALRDGALIQDFALTPPPLELPMTRESLRINAALGSIAELLRLLTELLALVHLQPVTTLRTGGVGVREVRRISDGLRIDPDPAVLLLELAALSGLLTLNVDTSRWESTAAGWLATGREDQWLWLVAAWLGTTRVPSLAGVPPTRGTEPASTSGSTRSIRRTSPPASDRDGGASVNALAAEAQRPEAPLLRRLTLAVMAELHAEALEQFTASGRAEPGRVPVLSPEAILARFRWRHPRLARRLRRLLPGFLHEAELLGLTGSGSLTRLGAAVARSNAEEAVTLLRDSLPQPLRTVLLQADLTAVAPGYLEPGLARELQLLADPEGQGPATTYRFSAASIRRALDAGRPAEAILAFLESSSSTKVPQPLRYLIEDTARRHGQIRVGHAGTYLQSDDGATLQELLSLPTLAALGLVQLAPTVLISRGSPVEVADALRALGLAPALDAAGPVPDVVRVPAADAVAAPALPGGPGPDPNDIDAQLHVLRTRSGLPQPDGTEVAPQLGLELLAKAIRLKTPVRLSLVDAGGNAEHLVLVPLSVGGGRVRVFDPVRETERVISIHRVADVELAPETGSPASPAAPPLPAQNGKA